MGLPQRIDNHRDRIRQAHTEEVEMTSSRPSRRVGLWSLLAVLLLLLGFSALYHPVTLKWKGSESGAPGLVYNIYRANSPCSAGSPDPRIATTAGLTFTDRSIKFGTFCYTVRASLNGVESIDSNTAEVQIRPSLRHR